MVGLRRRTKWTEGGNAFDGLYSAATRMEILNVCVGGGNLFFAVGMHG